MIEIELVDVPDKSILEFDIYDRQMKVIAKAGAIARHELLQGYTRSGIYITDEDSQRLKRKRIGQLYSLLNKDDVKINDLAKSRL